MAQLIAKATAMNSDHAKDQKSVAHHWKELKIESKREVHSEEILLSKSAMECMSVILNSMVIHIEHDGGYERWNALDDEEKRKQLTEVHKQICVQFGNEAFAALSNEDQKMADLFIWMGCCMHKELNSVKGGNSSMMAWWVEAGATGPMLLMNKDNAAAAAAGASRAKVRANEVSQGGGVKLTSLAGSLFRHKDEKKGQQDSFRFFFENRLGYTVRFPDTSNTRFQSHCQAAEELLVHLELYKEFLELVRDKKDARSFTHMEQNVYDALHNIPTLTELAVLALYSQSISQPYMRHVRGPGLAATNMLDLGPLHEHVKAHCRAIINEPGLLLSAAASYETGSLDGRPWQRPEAFYAVKQAIVAFPDLREVLIAFFKGALATWERFTSEFVEGAVTQLTTKARGQIHINATNDINEGALGAFRVNMRRMPSITMHQHNARVMYKTNNTSSYLETVSAADHQFLRQEARMIDSGGLERKRRADLARADEDTVREKRIKIDLRRHKVNLASGILDALVVRLDVNDIRSSPGTKPELELQLNWHRRWDKEGAVIPKKSDLKVKKQVIAALVGAVEYYNLHLPLSAGNLDELEPTA